jgi:hypothetical protein
MAARARIHRSQGTRKPVRKMTAVQTSKGLGIRSKAVSNHKTHRSQAIRRVEDRKADHEMMERNFRPRSQK